MLRDFLMREARIRFRWGESDCASMCDRWVQERAGISPMTAAGYCYRSGIGAAEVFAAHGDIVEACRTAMRIVGFTPVVRPEPGDIGTIHVRHRGRSLACMAIYSAMGWVSHLPSGLAVFPIGVRVSGMWRVPCRKP